MQKKIGLICLVMFLLASLPATALGRVDLGVRMPLQAIEALADINPNQEGVESTAYPVPFFTLTSNHTIGSTHLGLGIRSFGILVLNFAYPFGWVEWDLGFAELQVGLGGGAFGVFGMIPEYNTFFISPTIIPEISAYAKLGRVFRLGGGVKTLLSTEDALNPATIIYGELKAKLPF